MCPSEYSDVSIEYFESFAARLQQMGVRGISISKQAGHPVFTMRKIIPADFERLVLTRNGHNVELLDNGIIFFIVFYSVHAIIYCYSLLQAVPV